MPTLCTTHQIVRIPKQEPTRKGRLKRRAMRRPPMGKTTRCTMAVYMARARKPKVVPDTQAIYERMYGHFFHSIRSLRAYYGQTSGQIEAQAIQRQKDVRLGELLKQLRIYLPSLHREGGGQTSDYMVHPTALAHLRRRFNYICSALLRNDSLSDMSDRSVLYFELFEWLEVSHRVVILFSPLTICRRFLTMKLLRSVSLRYLFVSVLNRKLLVHDGYANLYSDIG